MSEIPSDLKYSKSHEWVRVEGDVATVGISDHAQALLGDLVYVELPDVGTELDCGEECCVVESVKAASDVYSPITGTIVEINDELSDATELVNQHPYHDGWLFKLSISNPDELNNLADAKEYQDIISEEA